MKRIILIVTTFLLLTPNQAFAWTISGKQLYDSIGLVYSFANMYTRKTVYIGKAKITERYQDKFDTNRYPHNYTSPPTTHILRDYIENNGNILIYPDSIINNYSSDNGGPQYDDGSILPVKQLMRLDEDVLRYPWETYTHNIKVIIPRPVNTISGTFYRAKPLVCVELHNRFRNIDSKAFCKSSLTTMNVIEKPLQYNMGIVFPDSLECVGSEAFSETPIRKVYCNEGLEEILSYAFAGCDSLRAFAFPPKITKVSDGVFSGCDLLENVDLNNATKVGANAFQNCTSLNSIDFKNVITIGNSAFESCTSLSSLNLRNVSSIGNRGFYSCKNLSTIDLSKVDSIGKQCFEQCDTLQSVYLKKGMKIGSRAFYGCKNLNKIDLSRISYLGDSALAYCSRLDFKKLDLTGIDYVGRSTFLGNNIGELYIPKTTKFGYRPFGGCGISKVAFEQGRDSIPNDFLGGAKVISESIAIPEGITHIGKNAFEFANTKGSGNNRSSLPTLILPSTLKSLESYVFGITFNYIGTTWGWTDGQRRWIDQYSVSFTDHVSRLIILAETPPEFTGKFSLVDGFGERYTGNGDQAKSPLGCQTDIPIYVPNGTIEAYKSAEGWNKYTNYHEMSELTGINGVTIDDAAEQRTDDGMYYDLQGRKVTNPQKGVYIHQGKKVMIQ